MGLDQYRVYAVVGDDTACGQFRMLRPLRYLQTAGLVFDWSIVPTWSEIEKFDPNIVLFQRQFTDEAIETCKKLKDKNIPCFYELDDNLHRILPNSPALKVYKQGSVAWRNTQRMISEVHGCTYSTIELADFYKETNPNCAVVENSIDFGIRDWDTPFAKPYEYASGKRLVLGWSGGAQHQDDIPILKNVIPNIMKKYPHVDVAMYTNSQEALKYFKMWGVPEERQLIIQPQSFNSYPHHLGLFDIGLCPVVNDIFNRCKSSLKVMEYSARGAVSVASSIAPYKREIVHGETGYIASSDAEFEQYISTLIENPQLLSDMRKSAFDKVHETRDMGKNCIEWPVAWHNLASSYTENPEGKTGKLSSTKIGRNDPCPCGSGAKYKKCCTPAYG